MKKTFFIFLYLISYVFAEENEKNPYQTNDYLLQLYEQKENLLKIKKKIDLAKDFKQNEDVKNSDSVKTRPLRDIDTIYLHKSKTLTLIFPKNVRIYEAYTFPKGQVETKDSFNSIDIIPTENLVSTTLSISYSLNNAREIKKMKINIHNYIHFKSKNNYHYSIIKYITPPKDAVKNSQDILNAYFKLYKNFPTKSTKFTIGIHTYYFMEDEINGKLRINNKRFNLIHIGNN